MRHVDIMLGSKEDPRTHTNAIKNEYDNSLVVRFTSDI